MVTKLIYLEHPDRAEPRATKPGEMLQTNYPPNTDLWKQARQRGRPMLLVHLGERVPTTDELARQNVPGTILHPGEKVIGPAGGPPCFQLGCVPLHDPLYGPRPPEEECFHDGGDRAPKAAPDACEKRARDRPRGHRGRVPRRLRAQTGRLLQPGVHLRAALRGPAHRVPAATSPRASLARGREGKDHPRGATPSPQPQHPGVQVRAAARLPGRKRPARTSTSSGPTC